MKNATDLKAQIADQIAKALFTKPIWFTTCLLNRNDHSPYYRIFREYNKLEFTTALLSQLGLTTNPAKKNQCFSGGEIAWEGSLLIDSINNSKIRCKVGEEDQYVEMWASILGPLLTNEFLIPQVSKPSGIETHGGVTILTIG